MRGIALGPSARVAHVFAMQWGRQTGVGRPGTVLAGERTRERREEPREPNVPDATLWKEKAVTLRHSARRQRNSLERQTLLTLAEDCDAIAAELESQAQQPGKPKPPGNPHRPPSREVPPPIQEPPGPMPAPPVDPPPAPLTAQKLQRPR